MVAVNKKGLFKAVTLNSPFSNYLKLFAQRFFYTTFTGTVTLTEILLITGTITVAVIAPHLAARYPAQFFSS
jgi:hypothetical protein